MAVKNVTAFVIAPEKLNDKAPCGIHGQVQGKELAGELLVFFDIKEYGENNHEHGDGV